MTMFSEEELNDLILSIDSLAESGWISGDYPKKQIHKFWAALEAALAANHYNANRLMIMRLGAQLALKALKGEGDTDKAIKRLELILGEV